ncbi:chemotaxis protein CheD [Alicyclobacillus herbarius]|uniref:chemotaxis protein CheD n=1 Tax=Alicyclobacillus herbarius TaxID=122960 RepID=UPI00040D2AE8|nr:chemotaxis protein CheD [Alicyclobacillus herbarius]
MTSEDALIQRIGIAEGAVVRRPIRLQTLGLGSCVGVVIYDETAGIAGMVHTMLPAAPGPRGARPQKYADLGTEWLIQAVLSAGGRASCLKAKLAGGAHMFKGHLQSKALSIGERNVASILTVLSQAGIPVVGEDVGGTVGRTIEFDTVACTLWIRTLAGTYFI